MKHVTTSRGTSRRKDRLRVGDRVSFAFGKGRIIAMVVEDRGDIGVGGRQLVTVRRPGHHEVLQELELPAEELRLLRRRSPRQAATPKHSPRKRAVAR